MKSDVTAQTPASNYQVLTPYEFLDDIQLEAQRAHTRVWTQTMSFESGSVTATVCNLLKAAASNNIDARLHCDWFNLKFFRGTYIFPWSSRFKAKLAFFNQLRNDNVAVTFTNPPTLLEHMFPYKGRNHMKITVIDDVAYLGGVNYGDNDFKFADFMIKMTDLKLVSAIAEIFMNLEKDRPHDANIHINQETALLIDGGKPGHSLILDETLAVVRQAQVSVHHTCQFVPDRKFLKALRLAYTKNLDVTVISPSGNTFNMLLSLVYSFNRLVMVLKHQKIPVHFKPMMIHAKLTIIDSACAVVGSHNMTANGIRMGTAEIALISRNKTLIDNLQAFFADLDNI